MADSQATKGQSLPKMDRPSIDSVTAWARSKIAGAHHEPAPRLVDNMGLILGAKLNLEIAEPFFIAPSTVAHWRMAERVPLVYLSPFLKLMTYHDLAFGQIEDTHHHGRGWTRRRDRAAQHGDMPGPVNIMIKTSFEEVMGRLRTFFGEDDAFHEGVEASRSQTSKWKMRSRVPDKVCRDICDKHGLSMSWLMTGFDEGVEDRSPI